MEKLKINFSKVESKLEKLKINFTKVESKLRKLNFNFTKVESKLKKLNFITLAIKAQRYRSKPALAINTSVNDQNLTFPFHFFFFSYKLFNNLSSDRSRESYVQISKIKRRHCCHLFIAASYLAYRGCVDIHNEYNVRDFQMPPSKHTSAGDTICNFGGSLSPFRCRPPSTPAPAPHTEAKL